MAQQNFSRSNNTGTFGNNVSGGRNQFGGQGNVTTKGDTYNTSIKDAANFISAGKFQAQTVQMSDGTQRAGSVKDLKKLKEMEVEDVIQMLKDINLQDYEKAFSDNDIDGPTLAELVALGGLEELGVKSKVHQAKIRGKVQTIKDMTEYRQLKT